MSRSVFVIIDKLAGPEVMRLVISYLNLEEGEFHNPLHDAALPSRTELTVSEARYRLTGSSTNSQSDIAAVEISKRLRDRRSWLPRYAREGVLPDTIDLHSLHGEELPWRTLEIPVEMPSQRVSRLIATQISADE